MCEGMNEAKDEGPLVGIMEGGRGRGEKGYVRGGEGRGKVNHSVGGFVNNVCNGDWKSEEAKETWSEGRGLGILDCGCV